VAHPRHDDIRQRYDYRCGYCGVSEVSAGGERTVDHYHPVSADGDDSDDNLVYSCYRCNQYKGANYPDAADRAQGRFILHPQRDDLTQYIRENELTGELEPLTETGRFHIEVLQLNREPLVEHRRERWRNALAKEIEQAYIREVAELRAEVAAYDDYVTRLEISLGIRET
jgi:hypothetical protein